MPWLEMHLSTILSLLVSGAGFMGAYYRLKFRVRAETTARLHMKEDLEKQIEAMTHEMAKNSVQSEKQLARFLEECRLCRKEVVDHLRDPEAHRDHPLEELRFNTLEKAIGDLKNDLNESIKATETRLCTRLERVEVAIRNGNGAKS
jgi:hypothetical protein